MPAADLHFITETHKQSLSCLRWLHIHPVATQTVHHNITASRSAACILRPASQVSPLSLCAKRSRSKRLSPSHLTAGMLLTVRFLQTALHYSWTVTFFLVSDQCLALGVMLSLSTLTRCPASDGLTVFIQNVLSAKPESRLLVL